MTRDDVIKAMAEAHWNSQVDEFNKWSELSSDEQEEAMAPMQSALVAIEALGVRLVPVEATSDMIWEVNLDETLAEAYVKMLSASPLRPEEE